MRIVTSKCWGALCVCLMVVATAAAEERGDRVTKVPDSSQASAPIQAADQAPVNLAELFSPMPKGQEVTRTVVMAGGSAAPAPDTGSVAAATSLVYSNTFGPFSFGPSGTGGIRIADDVVITGLDGCPLDRYIVRVNGDRNQIGDNRPFKVTVALYDSCPGAVIFPEPIPNTECVAEFADGGVHDVVCTIPGLLTIPLPATLYVAVTFDRGNAGWVVGALAEQGYSADRFDFPGFACAAALGGFPAFPHASFYTQIFARNCRKAFAAYHSSKQSGSAFTPGRLIRFGDDITLTRSDCKMTGFQVSVKGLSSNAGGAFLVDLKTALSNFNPTSGNRIPGTSQMAFVFTNKVQVFHFPFDPPIQLTQNNLFITFATGSDVVGPIVAGRPADIGSTVDTYVKYVGTAPTGEWQFLDLGENIWSAFDVTVFCEGDPPAGACCDMFLPDENGDSICRDLPEINCASSIPAPALWQEDKQCGFTNAGDPALCIGGENVGQPCSRQADCTGGTCQGGTNDGNLCTIDDNCPSGLCRRASCPGPFSKSCGIAACCLFDDSCEDETQNGCDAIEPTNEPRLFTRGTFCSVAGQRCPKGACLGREGECTLPRIATCLFGENAGEVCDPGATQPFPNVTGCHGVCVRSGSQNGTACLRDSECAGECARAQCEGGTNDGEPCRDELDCTQGACSLPNCPGAPGCQDPFCCTLVCALDPFCCDVHWDEACATDGLIECGFLRVANDECSDPTNPEKGARMLQVPDNVDGDTRQSTTSIDDPGFCCNADDPGGPGLGTIWYKFVAPPASAGEMFSSVQIQTCQSNNDDSLLQLFALETQGQGICSDLTPCIVSAQNCADGSVCDQDPIACGGLIPIGCSDDNDTCFSGAFPTPMNSKLCANELIPGDTYYFMVAAKASPDPEINNQGIYRIILGSPCSAPPPLPNDLCDNGQQLAGSVVKVDFDLSGTLTSTAPVSFDCPGPNCGDPSFPMANDAWYDWVAPANGRVEIDTCGGFACVGGTEGGIPCDPQGLSCAGGGSCQDVTPETTMVIYEGCGCPADVFNEIACSTFVTSIGCFLGSSSTFDVVKDTCYKIRLGGRNGNTPTGGLEVNLVECPSGAITFLDPPNGVVDAGQPHEPDAPNSAQGIQTVTISGPAGLSNFVGDLALVRACWTLCDSDTSVLVTNEISSVTDNGNGTFNLNLLRPMSPGAVTTLTLNGGDGIPSMGTFTIHPGNVNGDGNASAADVTRMRECLTTATCSVWECDVDRSGTCGPADLLRAIDLLNGGDDLAAWMGTAKPGLGICAPVP